MITIMKSATPPSGRKELSHQRIVEVAARQIRRSGVAGVGVADVMKQAGLTHGGFYAHFASRDALVVEAMELAGQQGLTLLGEHIARQRARGESPLQSLVKGYLRDSLLDDLEQGCVVAALGSELPRLEDALRDAARERVLAVIELARACLPASTAHEAPLLAASLVGSLQLARSLGGKSGKALLAQSREALLARYDTPNPSRPG